MSSSGATTFRDRDPLGNMAGLVRRNDVRTAERRPAPGRVGDRLHDVDSAADYLRCGRRLIYRLVAERRIRFTYAGRCLRIWQSDLDAYLLARSVEPLDVD